MSAGLNDRQRRFAELVVSGRPAGRAYEEAGYSARGDSADQTASKLLGSTKVSEYVQSLRNEAKTDARMSRNQYLDILDGIATSGEKDADKIKAIERACKMLGHDEPEKREIKVAVDPVGVMAGLMGATKDE